MILYNVFHVPSYTDEPRAKERWYRTYRQARQAAKKLLRERRHRVVGGYYYGNAIIEGHRIVSKPKDKLAVLLLNRESFLKKATLHEAWAVCEDGKIRKV